MENYGRKKYKQYSINWVLASRHTGFRRNSALVPANAGLFHYAGNNPVRYIDPDGRLQVSPDGGYIFLPELDSDGNLVYRNDSDNGVTYSFIYGFLIANDGTFIKARYKPDRNNLPSENFDCHGYTFTNGTFWINNDQVEKILVGDGYEEVHIPENNDILVQRERNGNVYHSAKIDEYDRQRGTIFVKEALGSIIFDAGDNKVKKTRDWRYKINPLRDSFYKFNGNSVVEKTPTYTMGEFYEKWNKE